MSDFYNICNESMYIVYLERKKSVHYKSFIICTSKRERERVISARTRQRDERRKKTERARYNHVLVSGITDGVHRPSRVNTVARPEPLILLRLSLLQPPPSSLCPISTVSFSSSSSFAFLTAPSF